MKKRKLKLLKQDVATAKTAWQAARKAKKPADEIARLRGMYEKALMLVEQAEADGKKDADEVDVPADYKAPEGKAAGGEGEGEGEGDDNPEDPEGKGANVVEMEELRDTIAEVVGEKLAEWSTANRVEALTEDKIKSIVEGVMAKHKAEGKMNTATISAIASEAVTEAMKSAKKPSKMGGDGKGAGGHNMRDAARAGARIGVEGKSGSIEIPYSLTKENMPLHMKQLFNIIADGLNTHVKGHRKIKLIEISEEEFQEGEEKALEFWNGLRTAGTKALTTTGTGTGAEWVPRDLASEVWRRLYLESQLAQMMLAREIEMPTDPFDIPIQTTRPIFYRNNVQNREARASTPGTAKNTLATQKCMALVQYSYEVSEDAIIAMLPMIQRLLGEAAAASLESMIINGDSAGTHMDADITDPDDVNKAWDGLRKLALASAALKVDMSTGGIVRANLLSMKRALGKWGRRPNDLVWIAGGLTENQFLGLDEVITADKRGSAGTTVTGTINSYLGIPIVVSEVAREDLNASGVYDGVTTTKGSLLLVNLSQFILGNRRDFMIETDRNIKSQTIDVVASFRKAFKAAETPGALSRVLAIGYNYNS